ncbi:hypothetical protein TBLA_0A03050 [Henningerozyma blattae CBS 6284]|uniref:FYVE-type domain-containing protein n=1 Tax=Henningerozyma blattae (strain ATCC 34711 / CBS 6284 / DSM 70876 / NBRC 10599 / NRRL Y-10934 / UCD 77-7) TaxID=1071380 RepID=I2GVF3_HENB6|nr:hypothetical protein TBLA_0A03050 [Tetrapisispora blattae CBS 6284]CCH58105.1 hypothetical protein TBLA_0A03050 [Tetrapisispora blattae CBS 6284]
MFIATQISNFPSNTSITKPIHSKKFHSNRKYTWQPDNEVKYCTQCKKRFTWFLRKHHCRHCGKIFCDNCSNNFPILLNPDNKSVTLLNRPNTKLYMTATEHNSNYSISPFRACDDCFKLLLDNRLILSDWKRETILQHHEQGEDIEETEEIIDIPRESSQTSNENLTGGESSNLSLRDSSPQESGSSNADTFETTHTSPLLDRNLPSNDMTPATQHDIDDSAFCPICAVPLAQFDDSSIHIEDCILRVENIHITNANATPTTNYSNNTKVSNEMLTSRVPFRNRMLIYKIPADSTAKIQECPICFEDLLPDEKIGRLECLCVFHYRCIKRWYKKKINQLGTDDPNLKHRNFCPFHDALGFK